ncbi:hypothetical protein ES705_49407 [subsurface metagenome]
MEIFNNASYDINLREFKLIQRHRRGYIRDIYDIGLDEVWDESEMIVPSKQVIIIGRNTDAGTFANYWQLEPGTINFNGADLIFGVPQSRWQLCYFDGKIDQEDGTIIDDTQNTVSGFERRSYQYGDGLWRTSNYLEATPGYLDADQSLAVDLTTFIATAKENFIQIEWQTKSELNNMGFYILRSETDESSYHKIASFEDIDNLKGLGNSPSGQKYQFLDYDVKHHTQYWYKLVDVGFSGRESFHGPVKGRTSYVDDNLFMIDLVEVPNQ